MVVDLIPLMLYVVAGLSAGCLAYEAVGDLSVGDIQPSTWWGVPIVAGEAGAGLLVQKLYGVKLPSTGLSARIHRGTKMEDFDDPTHGGAARSGGGFKGARNVEGGHTRFQRVFKQDKKGRY